MRKYALLCRRRESIMYQRKLIWTPTRLNLHIRKQSQKFALKRSKLYIKRKKSVPGKKPGSGKPGLRPGSVLPEMSGSFRHTPQNNVESVMTTTLNQASVPSRKLALSGTGHILIQEENLVICNDLLCLGSADKDHSTTFSARHEAAQAGLEKSCALDFASRSEDGNGVLRSGARKGGARRCYL